MDKIHYAASNLKDVYNGMSPFYAISPHCKVIYWFFDTSRLSMGGKSSFYKMYGRQLWKYS